MDDSDQRIGVLEEELKLLKGEVRRTLVDLRAFIMREESPLQDRTDSQVSQRARKDPPVAAEAVVVADNKQRDYDAQKIAALEEKVRSIEQGNPDHRPNLIPQPVYTQPSSPPPPVYTQPSGPPPPVYSQPSGPPPPIYSQPSSPPPPVYPPPAMVAQTQVGFPTPVVPDSSYASPGASQVNLAPRAEPDVERLQGPEPEPQPYAAITAEPQTRQPLENRGGPPKAPPDVERLQGLEPEPQLYAAIIAEPQTRQPPQIRGGPPKAPPDVERLQGPEPEPQHYAAITAESQTRQPLENRGGPPKAPPGPALARRKALPLASSGRSPDKASESQDGYTDQVEEIWESSTVVEEIPEDTDARFAGSDVNLVAALVRWVCVAKRRLGDGGLMDLVDLYIGSCRDSPGLKALIDQIWAMVGQEEPVYEAESPQEFLEMIHQLHGILARTGPIVHLAPNGLSTSEVPGEG